MTDINKKAALICVAPSLSTLQCVWCVFVMAPCCVIPVKLF